MKGSGVYKKSVVVVHTTRDLPLERRLVRGK